MNKTGFEYIDKEAVDEINKNGNMLETIMLEVAHQLMRMNGRVK